MFVYFFSRVFLWSSAVTKLKNWINTLKIIRLINITLVGCLNSIYSMVKKSNRRRTPPLFKTNRYSLGIPKISNRYSISKAYHLSKCVKSIYKVSKRVDPQYLYPLFRGQRGSHKFDIFWSLVVFSTIRNCQYFETCQIHWKSKIEQKHHKRGRNLHKSSHKYFWVWIKLTQSFRLTRIFLSCCEIIVKDDSSARTSCESFKDYPV